MFGVVAEAPVALRVLLAAAPRSLAALSREHRDGWGLASTLGDGWLVQKGVDCAEESERFHDVAREGRATSAIAHVRQKTVGPTSLANTHPFARGEWVLAHNGTVDDVAGLVARCSPERLAEVEGDTDSERLLAYLLTSIDEAADTRRGLVRGVRRLAGMPGRGAVNFLLSDGRRLFAHRSGRTLFALERDARCGRRTASVTFASERLTDEQWRELPQESLWLVQGEGGAGAPTLTPA